MATRPERPTALPARMSAPLRSAVSRRAVVLGLVLMVALCGITPFTDNRVGFTFIAGHHFPLGALLVLALLVPGGKPLIRLRVPDEVFRPGELITLWCMIVVSPGIPSSGLMRYLIPHIAAPLYFARPQFNRDKYVFPYLPHCLYLRNEDAVRWFCEARPVGERIPGGLWARPLAVWGLFTLALYVSFLSVSVLLRKQWVQNERFTFPLVQMPVETVAEPGRGQLFPDFYRARPLWVGSGLVMVIHTLNGVHRHERVSPGAPLLLGVDSRRLPPRRHLGCRRVDYAGGVPGSAVVV